MARIIETELVDIAVEQYHPHLGDERIVVLGHPKPRKRSGRVVPCTTSLVKGDAYLAATGEDGQVVVVNVCSLEWESSSADVRTALLDHALSWVCLDDEGGLALMGPAVQEFAEVLQRHGQWNHNLYGVQFALDMPTPPINYPNLDELIELCKAMSQMAPGALMATDRTVELDQSPQNVLAAIESATKALSDEKS